MRFPRRTNLNSQILLSVVAAALLMFSVVSGLTAMHERDRMFNSAKDDARRNVTQNLSGISRDLWNFDVAGLTAFMKGMTLSGSIVQAEVLVGDKVVAGLLRPGQTHEPDCVWTVDLMAPDASKKIGTLRISESYQELRKVLTDNVLAEIGAELLQIGGLAAVLFFIVHRLVIRHLKTLAEELAATTPLQHGTVVRIALHRRKPRHDELDTLVQAINRFRDERGDAEAELLRDIAERKRVEVALQKSEASLSEALKISRLGYWEYDVDRDEFTFNDQYYSLHRTDHAAVGGYRMSGAEFARKLLHPDDAGAVVATMRLAIGMTDAAFLSQTEARIVCADGELRWVLIRFKIERDELGRTTKLIGVNQDITDRKIAEQQADLVACLTVQKESAELANQAKSRFLAAASHDLRQPVHALHLFLGTLRNLDLPPQAQRPLANVLRCTESMDEMFVALLDVSKLDAGLIEPQLSNFPVMTLLSRIRHECEPQAQAKGLRLHVVPSSAWIRSDPLMTERILRNLVTNAIRYTSAGRILIGCRRKCNSTLELTVYDTGVGIAVEQQEMIFGEFYKVGADHPDQPGLGLGLSIVERLAKLLGAPLRLASAPGHGSMFAVRFPQATSTGIVVRPPLPADGAVNFRGRTVLVLDDDHAILEATRGLLEQWGCYVITADTTAAAIEQAMDSPAEPDVLICDYRLRGAENGIDAVAMIREEFNSDIPALLITGDTSPRRIVALNKTGLPVLHKPLRESEFRAALTTLLFSREADPVRISACKQVNSEESLVP